MGREMSEVTFLFTGHRWGGSWAAVASWLLSLREAGGLPGLQTFLPLAGHCHLAESFAPTHNPFFSS